MLPQFLVQNKILGTEDARGRFHIDWTQASPILNLNFFYEERQVEESSFYRQLQRPWYEVDDPGESWSSLQLHNYFYSTKHRNNTGDNSWLPANIYVGSLVGCVKLNAENPGQPSLVIVNNQLIKYDFNEETERFEVNTQLDAPSLFRSSWMSGLKAIHTITMSDPHLTSTDSTLTYLIPGNEPWIFQKYTSNYEVDPPLLFTKDIIFCDVYFRNELIYHTIVNISRTLNTSTNQYEYRLTIPNLHFPSGAKLRFY